MKIKQSIYLLVSLCLIIICAAGCWEETAASSSASSETNDPGIGKTVTAMLDIEKDAIKSIKIIQMGDGQTVVLDSREEIGRIMDRLQRVKITKALGTQGYTLTGYNLEFLLEDGSETNTVSIQLDSSEFSYHVGYEKHFYEISDDESADKLNDYFEAEKYK